MAFGAQDAQELRAMLTAQTSEAEMLKARLAKQDREVVRLQQRLRDAEGELAVAADATTSATERLGSHAERHGLVLASAVERSGADRSGVEHELQIVEGKLHERDIEIRRLRKQAHDLEAAMHSNDMEIKGLHAIHEGSTNRARNAADGVDRAMKQIEGASGRVIAGPSRLESQRHEDTANALAAKRQELEDLKRKAESVAQEAKRMEVEQGVLTDRLSAYQQDLSGKKNNMEAHDRRFNEETALLREHCEQLRKTLHVEQRDAVGVDQRAVLHPQCSQELEHVRREMQALLEKAPRLNATLRQRGQAIRSPPVEDGIDARVHQYLRELEDNGAASIPIVWRLSQGEYLLGDSHVFFKEEGGGLYSQRPGGQRIPLQQALRA